MTAWAYSSSVMLKCGCRAEADGGLDLGPQLTSAGLSSRMVTGRVLAQLEDARRLGLADPVTLAEIEVDRDPHQRGVSRRVVATCGAGLRRYRTTQGCWSWTTIFEWSLR